MTAFSARVLYPLIAPLVNHLFENGSSVEAMFISGASKPLFLYNQQYYTQAGKRNIPFNPFNLDCPAGDVYDASGHVVISKDLYQQVEHRLEVGVHYNPLLTGIIEACIELGLQNYQKWNTDRFLHRKIVNYVDDQCLANLSGVGAEFSNTINELNNEFVRRNNESVKKAMSEGEPITYEMAVERNKHFLTAERDHLLRNYIYTSEVDAYFETLGWNIFGVISNALPVIYALYNHESSDRSGWRIFTCSTEKGNTTVFLEGDYRVLDWHHMRGHE